ncbi:DUF5683 domain-containing protein [Chitinivibrio alkaliphilus]|uniref:DUF5683 domain-containing protein n=1 Tax=Chitinivibrio alkaliphilus ACht1 TaxID=1313304 RepID=U7D4W3_9BACT|nr:DUF5683 domain-containing protein [Chitinivibrio alkaliphilus]ERP31554.1 hypothetical protein CALK_1600 [Chitinivibrio alkaliphilus ACht1]
MIKAVLLTLTLSMCLSAEASLSPLRIAIPGAVRFSRQDPLRGALQASLFTGFSTATIARRQIYHAQYDSVDLRKEAYYELTDIHETSSYRRITYFNDLLAEEYSLERERRRYYNYALWAGGVFAWSLFDGIAVEQNLFDDRSTPREPRRALRLSLIPFLGLGQLYNGESYKAGFVWTTQIGCAFSAIQLGAASRDAEDAMKRVHAHGEYDNLTEREKEEFTSFWEDRYDRAQRERTMFLWYGVVAYLYGVFDAYIDAHLSNFNTPFSLVPSWNSSPEIALIIPF